MIWLYNGENFPKYMMLHVLFNGENFPKLIWNWIYWIIVNPEIMMIFLIEYRWKILEEVLLAEEILAVFKNV